MSIDQLPESVAPQEITYAQSHDALGVSRRNFCRIAMLTACGLLSGHDTEPPQEEHSSYSAYPSLLNTHGYLTLSTGELITYYVETVSSSNIQLHVNEKRYRSVHDVSPYLLSLVKVKDAVLQPEGLCIYTNLGHMVVTLEDFERILEKLAHANIDQNTFELSTDLYLKPESKFLVEQAAKWASYDLYGKHTIAFERVQDVTGVDIA